MLPRSFVKLQSIFVGVMIGFSIASVGFVMWTNQARYVTGMAIVSQHPGKKLKMRLDKPHKSPLSKQNICRLSFNFFFISALMRFKSLKSGTHGMECRIQQCLGLGLHEGSLIYRQINVLICFNLNERTIQTALQ